MFKGNFFKKSYTAFTGASKLAIYGKASISLKIKPYKLNKICKTNFTYSKVCFTISVTKEMEGDENLGREGKSFNESHESSSSRAGNDTEGISRKGRRQPADDYFNGKGKLYPFVSFSF